MTKEWGVDHEHQLKLLAGSQAEFNTALSELTRTQAESNAQLGAAVAKLTAQFESVVSALSGFKSDLHSLATKVNAPQDMKAVYTLQIGAVTLILGVAAIVAGNFTNRLDRMHDEAIRERAEQREERIRSDGILRAEQKSDNERQLAEAEKAGFMRGRVQFLYEQDANQRAHREASLGQIDDNIRDRVTNSGFNKQDGQALERRLLELTRELGRIQGRLETLEKQ